MVDGDAVFESVRAAGVGRDVAAYGTGALARGIRGEVVAVRFQMVRKSQIHDARLDQRVSVAQAYLENPFHARQRDHDAAANWEAATRKAGSGSPRQKRDIELIASENYLPDLFG